MRVVKVRMPKNKTVKDGANAAADGVCLLRMQARLKTAYRTILNH